MTAEGQATLDIGEAPERWGISAKWASKQHECTLKGIKLRCGGTCCISRYWPPASYNPEGERGPCGHLGEKGCDFTPEERPVVCLLYPLRLNAQKKLVYHLTATYGHGHCAGNYGTGPPLIEALEPQLTALFGAEQYERVKADVLAGRDSYFDVSPELAAAWEAEREREAANLHPVARA